MSLRDVVITGIGLISSLGEGTDAHWNALSTEGFTPRIDAERFARHFGSERNGEMRPAPVIEVSGRLYPVEVRYRPVFDADASPPAKREAARVAPPDERTMIDAIVDAVDELARVGPGDILVFLAGEREIRETAVVLRGHHPPHTESFEQVGAGADHQRVPAVRQADGAQGAAVPGDP